MEETLIHLSQVLDPLLHRVNGSTSTAAAAATDTQHKKTHWRCLLKGGEVKYMAFCHARDFLFCDICGTLLSLNSHKYVTCPSCGFKRDVKEIVGRETSYTITAEDIRRELNIEPFVQIDRISIDDGVVQRAVVNEACPQCRHPQLEYYTKQLRSADEGQTVFYECPKCKHKFSVNT